MRCFKFALEGIADCARTQRNMRIHLTFAFYVVVAGMVTGIRPAEWAAVLICAGLVISLELVNTAIESVCDGVTTEFSPGIKRAKDAAAGAVLVSAFGSVIVGCIVFLSHGRPLLALDFARENRLAAGAIALTLPLWIIYIFKPGRSHE